MNLYFLRHALAEERQNGIDHPERKLTDEGIAQARAMGTFARKNNLRIDKVFSSPFRRAKETAYYFASELPAAYDIQVVDWLEIDAPREILVDEIDALALNNTHSLLVGHEPDISLAISSLLLMRLNGIKIRKASLTCLSCNDPEASEFQLRWSITPDLIK